MKKLLAEDHQSFSKWIRDKINEELARSDDKDLAGGESMLQEDLVCDECGRSGQDPVADLCGDWLGTPENGYPCPDIICLECRIESEH